MQLEDFRILRFQFRRDRVIGDSQVRAEEVHVATLELVDRDRRKRTWLCPVAVRAASRPGRDRAGVSRGGLARSRGAGAARSGAWGLAASRRQPAPADAAVSRGGPGGALGSRGEAGGAAAAPPARQPARPRPRPMRPVSTSTSTTMPSASSSGMPTQSATAPSRSRWGIPDFERDLHRLDLLRKTVRQGRGGHDRRQRGVGRQGSAGEDGGHASARATSCCGSRTRSCATTSTGCACCAGRCPGR